MAGSPGAGKTEIVNSLLQDAELTNQIVRLDTDILCSRFPIYNGTNSHFVQKGASYLVDFSFSRLLEKGYSLVLDGTFAFERSIMNIQRVLKRGYKIIIFLYIRILKLLG